MREVGLEEGQEADVVMPSIRFFLWTGFLKQRQVVVLALVEVDQAQAILHISTSQCRRPIEIRRTRYHICLVCCT